MKHRVKVHDCVSTNLFVTAIEDDEDPKMNWDIKGAINGEKLNHLQLAADIILNSDILQQLKRYL